MSKTKDYLIEIMNKAKAFQFKHGWKQSKTTKYKTTTSDLFVRLARELDITEKIYKDIRRTM